MSPAREGLPISLRPLLGVWEGHETLSATAWSAAGSAVGRYTYTGILGGRAVSQNYVQTRADGPAFELHGVLGVDPASGAVVWYGFDTLAPLPEAPARGGWRGEELHLHKVTSRGRARHVVSVLGDVLHHDISTARADAPEDFRPFLRGAYRRLA